jgi:putative flavoprotein involved in K+ transport
VATGSHASAVVPRWASELDPSIVQMTAKQYHNPGELPPGDALVVGAGNSGVQIGMEVARTRTTWLAGRDTGRLPRRILHHDVSFWTEALGIMRIDVESSLGRSIVARIGHAGFPVVGISRAGIAASGIRRAPRVEGVEKGKPRLADGRTLDVRSVVWCCGLRPDFSFVDGLSPDEHGFPIHHRGRSEEVDGLFFVGLRFQRRLGSDLLGGVGVDAEEIVRDLAAEASRRAA